MSQLDLEGVIFDADGVLFDTENLGLRVWRELGQELGLHQPAEHYLHFVGRSRADILHEMAVLFGPDFPSEEFMTRGSRRALDIMEREGIPMKPGVYELLSFLKDKGVPTALATSTYRDRTDYRMGRTGRAGHDGFAVSFSTRESRNELNAIQKLIDKKLTIMPLESFEIDPSILEPKKKKKEQTAPNAEGKHEGKRKSRSFKPHGKNGARRLQRRKKARPRLSSGAEKGRMRGKGACSQYPRA